MNYKKPKRTFEKSGMVSPERSYFVPLENVTNTDRQDIKTMVDLGRYFTIFAPRQSGKTTFFNYFCRAMEKDPAYLPILLSFQRYGRLDVKTFYQSVQKKLYFRLTARLKAVNCPQLDAVEEFLNSHPLKDGNSFYELFEKLNEMITFKKIVILIDEFDGIPISELENFLLTLRELYQEYKEQKDKALYSVGLIGVRNLTKLVVGGVSPFNIADEVSLPPFSLNDIHDLYAQYTEETNQAFEKDASQKVHEETGGQPWLVNRLGTILTMDIKSGVTDSITARDVDRAVTLLLEEKNPHFNNLHEKIQIYKDAFINIAQNQIPYDPDDDEQLQLEQYGLIRKEEGKARVANPIYEKRYTNIKPSQFVQDPMSSTREKKVFISYSHKDRPWLDLLVSELEILKYQGVRCWFDDNIRVGERWSPEIQHAIETSRVALCLITSNFLGSTFVRNREIPEILKRRNAGMRIIPVLLETCSWKQVPWLAEIQIKDQTPLSKRDPEEQKEKLVEIVDLISECFTNAEQSIIS